VLPWAFAPSGFALGSLDQDFARPPLTCFASEWDFRRKRSLTSRHPRVSIGFRLALDRTGVCTPIAKATLGVLHLYVPCPSVLETALAMGSPCIASCITADRPMRLGPHPNLP
jgi:hypothetical protein